MNITALIISLCGFSIIYGGILMARRVEGKLAAAALRLGAMLVGFLSIPIIHMLLNSPVQSTSESGKYFLFIAILGFVADRVFAKKASA
jgi:hypothetical protein